MLGPDGRAKKGEIEIIGKNVRGALVPTVKWNDGTKAQIPFGSLRVDTRPTPKAANTTGPQPMDLGATELTCYHCQKKGHIARACKEVVARIAAVDEDGSDSE